MVGDHEIAFGPFRLECDNQQLWPGEQRLALQPKPLAVAISQLGIDGLDNAHA